MPIGKTLKKLARKLKKKKKPKPDWPDMPEDPTELARAMFWPNEQKRREAAKKKRQ